MTTDEEIRIISQIAAGLLASGQFSYPHPDAPDEMELKTTDYGKDWRQGGFLRRRDIQAVERAEWVLAQIKENVIAREKEKAVDKQGVTP